eukprot:scaffold269524_cov35-Tisochrysis_lutea.AAC.4
MLYGSLLLGEAERAIRQFFDLGRATAPSILFLDEIDALVGRRDADTGGGGGGEAVQLRVLSTLLNEMDGVEPLDQSLCWVDYATSLCEWPLNDEGIALIPPIPGRRNWRHQSHRSTGHRPLAPRKSKLVPHVEDRLAMGCTIRSLPRSDVSLHWLLAIIPCCRFDELILVPPPDAAGRRQVSHARLRCPALCPNIAPSLAMSRLRRAAPVLDVHTRGMPLHDDVDLGSLAATCNGWSGAEMAELCRAAAMEALRGDILAPKVERAHFEAALASNIRRARSTVSE